MPKTQPKSGDLLALAMRRARDDVAQGRVPKHPPELKADDPSEDAPDGRQQRRADADYC